MIHLHGVAGLFFGPLGLIAACGLSDVTMRRYIRLLAEKEGLLNNVPSGSTHETM